MNAVFVYGTLKQGEERGQSWPRKPLRVRSAFARGTLYDLGEYPAMVAGQDWVAGECWDIADADLDATFEVLDEIEGFANRADDLYRRTRIVCYETPDEQSVGYEAYTYIYVEAEHLTDSRRIRVNARGICRWP